MIGISLLTSDIKLGVGLTLSKSSVILQLNDIDQCIETYPN